MTYIHSVADLGVVRLDEPLLNSSDNRNIELANYSCNARAKLRLRTVKHHIHRETIHAAIVKKHCPVVTGLGKFKDQGNCSRRLTVIYALFTMFYDITLLQNSECQ